MACWRIYNDHQVHYSFCIELFTFAIMSSKSINYGARLSFKNQLKSFYPIHRYSTVEKCLYINPCSPIYFFSSGISVLSAMLVQNPEIDEIRMYYFLGMFKNVRQPPCNPLLEGLVEQEDRWIKWIILYSYSIQSVILQYYSLSFRKRMFEWLWDVVL